MTNQDKKLTIDNVRRAMVLLAEIPAGWDDAIEAHLQTAEDSLSSVLQLLGD